MSSSSAASAAPSFSASSMSPVADARSSAPSAVPTTARRDTRSTTPAVVGQVGHHVGQRARPGRCSRPPAPASTARSAVTAARRVLVVEHLREQARRAPWSAARHSTASAPCAGAGSICSGVEQLGRLVDAAEPAQPGRGDDHGVELTRAAPCAMRVSTLPRIGTTSQAEAEGLELGDRAAASRCRPSTPAGSSPSTRPSRATSASRGSSRGGTAAMHEPRVRCRREVLVGVHGEVDLAGHERVAQLRDEHADAERGRSGRTTGRRRC